MLHLLCITKGLWELNDCAIDFSGILLAMKIQAILCKHGCIVKNKLFKCKKKKKSNTLH